MPRGLSAKAASGVSAAAVAGARHRQKQEQGRGCTLQKQRAGRTVNQTQAQDGLHRSASGRSA